MKYTKELVKESVNKNVFELSRAWDEATLEDKNEAYKEGFMAWEWLLRTLKAAGLEQDDALAIRSIWMRKAGWLGTYEAIAQCLNSPTFIMK